MESIIRYVYYRIAHALKNFNSEGREMYDFYAKFYLMMIISFNLVAVVSIFLYLVLDIKGTVVVDFITNRNTINNRRGFPWPLLLLFGVIYFCLSQITSSTDSFYLQLHKKYKREKHRVFKGWLIVVYAALSFGLYLLCLYFLC